MSKYTLGTKIEFLYEITVRRSYDERPNTNENIII